MALLLIENPPSLLALDTDWTTFLIRENASNIGTGLSIPIFTLTNWDGSTTKPQIKQGSIIEVGGSLYQADVDTPLTDEGGLSDGTVHIKLVPGAGSPDPLTVVPTLTNDVIPVWDAVKGGWYTSANKYLPFEMEKAAAVYTEKGEYRDQNTGIIFLTNGKIKTLTIENDLLIEGTVKWKYYFKDASSITENTFFDAVKAWIPNTGDFMSFGQGQGVGGQFTTIGVTITGINRNGVSDIQLGFIQANGVGGAVLINDGSGSVLSNSIEIMSNFDAIT